MLQLQTFPQQEGFFLARLGGIVSVEGWGEALRELEGALAATDKDCAVIVLTDLVGLLGVPERTEVGSLPARHLGRLRKVALHVEAEKIKGVVEAEARRMGLNLRILPSYEACVAWVSS